MAMIFASLMGLPAFALEIGQLAPDFELPGRTAPIKLSDYRGKTVYLDFWASWCGPCKQSFPWMSDMQVRYSDKGLRIIAIDVDQVKDEAKAKAFLKDHPVRFEVAFDPSGKTPRAYAVKSMPTSVLIGPDGKVLMIHSGFRPEESQALEGQIKMSLK